MSEKTLFQKIADKEIPSDMVYEDDQCVAFRDINPAAPTHILVVPRKLITRPDLIDEEDEALVGHMFTAARRIAAREGLVDYRLVMNNGPGAGQSVFHIHLHILGGRPMGWPPG